MNRPQRVLALARAVSARASRSSNRSPMLSNAGSIVRSRNCSHMRRKKNRIAARTVKMMMLTQGMIVTSGLVDRTQGDRVREDREELVPPAVMRHDDPFRRGLGRGQVGRHRLDVEAVHLEIGRPAPARVLVAIDHRAAVVCPDRLDEFHVAAATRLRVRPGIGGGEEPGVLAQVHPLRVGAHDPHHVMLRQRVVEERDHEEREQRQDGPLHIAHGSLTRSSGCR